MNPAHEYLLKVAVKIAASDEDLNLRSYNNNNNNKENYIYDKA